MNIVKELQAKVAELESKLVGSASESSFGVRQFQSVVGEFVEGSVRHKLGEVTATASGQVVLQTLLFLRATEQNSVNVKLRAGGLLLYDSDRTLSVGDNEVFLMSSLMLAEGEHIEVWLEVIAKEVYTNYLSSASLYLWSNSVSVEANEKTLINADCADGLVGVVLTVDRKLYTYESESLPSELDFSDFTYYADGDNADVTIANHSGKLTAFWFRLAEDGVVYCSTTSSVQNEWAVASGVSAFSVSAYGDRSGVLVCYIREGLPYFKTIENGVVSSELAFEVSDKYEFKNICTLKSNSTYVYVVATAENGSNTLFEVAPELNFGGLSTDLVHVRVSVKYS